MNEAELFDALLELAAELGVDVRALARGADDGATSGVCRLRGRPLVLLAAGDPLDQRVAVLAAALRDHAGEACESRYLPPAVRAALAS